MHFSCLDIATSIGKLEEQKRLLESRADFTKQEFSEGEVDITEEYDSDEDKKWRGEKTRCSSCVIESLSAALQCSRMRLLFVQIAGFPLNI